MILRRKKEEVDELEEVLKRLKERDYEDDLEGRGNKEGFSSELVIKIPQIDLLIEEIRALRKSIQQLTNNMRGRGEP